MPLSRVQPQDYCALLEKKVETVCELMAPFSPPEPQVYSSPPVGFRLRAEFRMWHDDDSINYVMFRREDPRTPVVVTDFVIADARIQYLMPLLREKLIANPRSQPLLPICPLRRSTQERWLVVSAS